MPQFVPLEFVAGAPRNKASRKRRWGRNEETRKRIPIAPFAVLWLRRRTQPIRANSFRPLQLERFFSCLRRTCHSNNHHLNMMEKCSDLLCW
jgi:hypothetical protein